MILTPQNSQGYLGFIPSYATNSLRNSLHPPPLGTQDTNHSLTRTVITATHINIAKKSDTQMGRAGERVRSIGPSTF